MKQKIENAAQFKEMLTELNTIDDVKKALNEYSFGAYRKSFLNACMKKGIDVSALITARKSRKRNIDPIAEAFAVIADYLKDFPQDVQEDFEDLQAKIDGEKARVEREKEIAELERKLAELKAECKPSSLLETADKKSKKK